LEKLAGSMTSTVAQTGRFQHVRLPRGLELVCERREGRWRLAMAREAPAVPSESELAAVCSAFRIPDGSDCAQYRRTRTHPKSGRQIIYNVIEVRWTEVEQMAL
jgi:hypothetical protein